MVRFFKFAAMIFCAATFLGNGIAVAQPIPGAADITRIPEEQRRLPQTFTAPSAQPQAEAPALPAMSVPEGAEKIIFRLHFLPPGRARCRRDSVRPELPCA